MRNTLIICFFMLLACIISCSEKNENKNQSEENCEAPAIKDPNEVKPMALMMRTMADYCDTMRLKIRKGEPVDSVRFPLMPFRNAEPTDSSVLETLFFDNATHFENAWRILMKDTIDQAADYTAVVNACVHCHNSYCSGPLRRIRKLTLDYKE